MSMSVQSPVDSQDLIDLISSEILLAREQTRPTSRQELATIVHKRTGMSHADAFEFVDRYCDDNEPGVPGYLQEEFAIPYLKVLAIFNAAVALVICYYGVMAYRAGRPGWWVWVCIGVCVFGLGALSWVKSLEREHERHLKRR
jgi:hypothetical protein